MFVWEKGTGVNGWTECVGCEYLYGKTQLGLTVELNLCVGYIFMGEVNCG
jgi:hypothetical protein